MSKLSKQDKIEIYHLWHSYGFGVTELSQRYRVDKTNINSITIALVSKYGHNYIDNHEVTVSKSSTIAKRLIHMRNFFKSIESKAIKENPVPGSPLKVFFRQSDFTISKDWRIFTNDELTAIRNLITDDLRHSSINNQGSKLAIFIESYTGMRVGELQALKFSNIVYENDVWTLRINSYGLIT